MAGAVVRTASSTLAPLSLPQMHKRLLCITRVPNTRFVPHHTLSIFGPESVSVTFIFRPMSNTLPGYVCIDLVPMSQVHRKTSRVKSSCKRHMPVLSTLHGLTRRIKPQTTRARSAPETRARRLRRTVGRRSQRASTRGSTAHSAQHSAMRRLSMRGVCFVRMFCAYVLCVCAQCVYVRNVRTFVNKCL